MSFVLFSGTYIAQDIIGLLIFAGVMLFLYKSGLDGFKDGIKKLTNKLL